MPGGNNTLWWSNRQGWRPTAQGGPEGGGGGYGSEYTAVPGRYRDSLDAARSGAFGSRTGEATYPDGYLRPSESRRRDAPASVYRSLGDRACQRGVNSGVKMDKVHYFWPRELDPSRALQAQQAARRDGAILATRRTAPYGEPATRLMHGPSLGQIAQDAGATAQKAAAMHDWMPAALW